MNKIKNPNTKLTVYSLFSVAVLALVLVTYMQFSGGSTWNNFLAATSGSNTSTSKPASCGPAQKTYKTSETSWAGALCKDSGIEGATPSFPLKGKTANWTCSSSNPVSIISCTATRENSLCGKSDGGTFSDAPSTDLCLGSATVSEQGLESPDMNLADLLKTILTAVVSNSTDIPKLDNAKWVWKCGAGSKTDSCSAKFKLPEIIDSEKLNIFTTMISSLIPIPYKNDEGQSGFYFGTSFNFKW